MRNPKEYPTEELIVLCHALAKQNYEFHKELFERLDGKKIGPVFIGLGEFIKIESSN